MNRAWPIRFFFLYGSTIPFFFVLLLIQTAPGGLELPPFTLRKAKMEESRSPSPIVKESKQQLSLTMPDLVQEVNLQVMPSPFPGKDAIYLHLKRSDAKREISPGERIYLAYVNDILTFKDSYTPFSLFFKEIENGKAFFLLEIEASFLPQKEKLVTLSTSQPTERLEKQPDLFTFSKAKYLGENLLLKIIDPTEPVVHNIIFRNQLLSLTTDQYLLFKEGEWQVSDHPEMGSITVKIKEVAEGSKLILEGWDASHEDYYLFSLSSYSIPFNPISLEEIVKNIRIRNEKQFSCKIQDTRVVFHVGDALIRDKGVWKPCKDKEALLQHKGEVFLIETLEKKGRRQTVRGSYFSLFKNKRKEIALEVDKQIKRKSMRRKRK